MESVRIQELRELVKRTPDDAEPSLLKEKAEALWELANYEDGEGNWYTSHALQSKASLLMKKIG